MRRGDETRDNYLLLVTRGAGAQRVSTGLALLLMRIMGSRVHNVPERRPHNVLLRCTLFYTRRSEKRRRGGGGRKDSRIQ